jgi:two-component system, response regulator PdtaR
MSSRVALVVDDEPLIRMIIVDILQDVDFEVLEAIDAHNALEVLAVRENVRLLCTDVQMPGSMDGVELARIAKALYPKIQVIIISGFTKTASPAGVPFLIKPFQPDHLVKLACAATECLS